MRREMRGLLVIAGALVLGVVGAEPYARAMAPYYDALARLVAVGPAWEVGSVAVRPGRSGLGAELTLEALVRNPDDLTGPHAQVRGRIQVGEVVETPIVYWTVLLLWPATTLRSRLVRLALGVPGFLLVEALTTGSQLLLPMAQASAVLRGQVALTPWDHWSHFLEAGGQFVLACGLAGVIGALGTRRTVASAAARDLVSSAPLAAVSSRQRR